MNRHQRRKRKYVVEPPTVARTARGPRTPSPCEFCGEPSVVIVETCSARSIFSGMGFGIPACEAHRQDAIKKRNVLIFGSEESPDNVETWTEPMPGFK